MTFSIIIPVYNAEKYLREALDSVRMQTFTDWECVCVDDGSKDCSPEILDDYAAKDQRFRVIHQVNGGEGTARNVGMAEARGDYVTWLDADDELAPTRFEVAAKIIELEHPDLVRMYYQMAETRPSDFPPPPNYGYKVLNDPKSIFHFGWGELNGNGMVWLWFAKRELLQGMRFRPEMRVKTDCIFSTSLAPRITKLCVSQDKGLFYRWLPTSMAHATRRAQDCINCQRAFLDLWNEQKDVAAKRGELEFVKRRVKRMSQNDLLDWVRGRPKGESADAAKEVRDAYVALRDSGAFSPDWVIDKRYWPAFPIYDLIGCILPFDVVDWFVGRLRCFRSKLN